MKARLAIALLAAGCGLAAAQGWPPSPQAQARIDALKRTLGDPAATAAERRAARDELARLLMHPDAKSAPAPMAPRAAVDPAAPLAPPAAAKLAAPGLTPVAPPERAPLPRPDGRGGTVVPAGKNAIDPKTGALLIDAGNGWIDPATGRFVPKPRD